MGPEVLMVDGNHGIISEALHGKLKINWQKHFYHYYTCMICWYSCGLFYFVEDWWYNCVAVQINIYMNHIFLLNEIRKFFLKIVCVLVMTYLNIYRMYSCYQTLMIRYNSASLVVFESRNKHVSISKWKQ